MNSTHSNLYYIASLVQTLRHHEHITFWGIAHSGYKLTFDSGIGTYDFEAAKALNDGQDCIAIPVASIVPLLSPEPHLRPHAPVRFYDTRGPVVNNSRANWNRLIKASLTEDRLHIPRPQCFSGIRRAFAIGPLQTLVDHSWQTTAVGTQKLARLSDKTGTTSPSTSNIEAFSLEADEPGEQHSAENEAGDAATSENGESHTDRPN